MSEPTPYKLRFPVELRTADGSVIETITELSLRRMSGADARRVLNMQGKGAGEFTMATVCASAQIPPSTFDKLDAEDALAAFEVASGFLGSAPPTSKT